MCSVTITIKSSCVKTKAMQSEKSNWHTAYLFIKTLINVIMLKSECSIEHV